MKQRIQILMATAIVALSVSCQEMADVDNNASLSFIFAAPVQVIPTKATTAMDTNSYILSIVNTTGQTIYNGKYGARPQNITVPAGTYDISVISNTFDGPQFDMPQYGDNKVVVVSNGQKANVSFLCKMTNASVKLLFSERFKEKYGSDGIVLSQESSSIKYSCNESRYAYLKPGNVEFLYDESGTMKPLFSRLLKAGECHTLELDASNNESESAFTISVDTTRTPINEKIVVGDDNGGANGKSAQTAMSISEASNHIGDTLWVCGYIVGTSVTTSAFNREPPFATDAHLALAESVSASERSEICPVELSKKALKESLGLQTNPEHLGKKLAVRGVIVESYFGSMGIKAVSEYEIQK